MRQRILLILITCLLLLLAPVCLLVWGFCLPAQYEETFLGELKYKCQRLEEAESPRIVLVGGSSVAFGVDSALMEAELPDYQVVNFGMYAALGTTVMLDLSEDAIRPGDIVILLPEQQEQTLSGYFDGGLMWQALDGAFSLLGRLDRAHWGALAGSFPSFAAGKLGYLLSGTGPQPTGVYARSSFNEWGDVESPLCERNTMPGGYDPDTPIRFRAELVSGDFLTAVNDYAGALEERGAVLWYGFCPMNALAVEDNADPDGYCDWLREALDCPLLGDPHHSILEAGWFYDTNFHLNASGKTVYTRQLIRDIKAMLGDSSPTEISLPDQPAPAEAETAAGESEDAACFTYDLRDGRAAITGLTQEGLAREELTLPTRWADCPVTEVAASAFAGAARLRRVTVPEGIAVIRDGAFRDCGSLEAIVLEGETPSACHVGEGLLEGTDALIYVPASALSAYRTDYFWSPHAGRILPDGTREAE